LVRLEILFSGIRPSAVIHGCQSQLTTVPGLTANFADFHETPLTRLEVKSFPRNRIRSADVEDSLLFIGHFMVPDDVMAAR
jgi:hypothetical protein